MRRQDERSRGMGVDGDIINRRTWAHKSKSLPEGFSLSLKGRLVINISFPPNDSASFLVDFSLGLMNGDTNTPPFKAVCSQRSLLARKVLSSSALCTTTWSLNGLSRRWMLPYSWQGVPSIIRLLRLVKKSGQAQRIAKR